ncbi:MAG: glycosylase, partial [Lachnospiraceae bacterium]|nr:glycosylase [Lachnospiraceae bacterium]
MTCNHDTPRTTWTLDEKERKVAYAMLLTLPGVPFIYYGDEIGIKYIPDMPTKDGGYTRTGTRTPMQWDDSKNCGFSSASEDKLYLPIDKTGPNVKDELAKKDSLINLVKEILAVRHSETDLRADGPFEVLLGTKNSPFIYKRGSLTIAVNPKPEAKTVDLNKFSLKNYKDTAILSSVGDCKVENGTLQMSGQSFVILK